MKYYVFLDESGDHGLNNIDPDFPVFVLCGVVISQDNYEEVSNWFDEIKEHFWGNMRVIFHSRDIRKCDKEFKILLDYDVKSDFYKRLDRCIISANYSVITSVIDKDKFLKKYGKLQTDVYGIALSFIVERTVFYLDSVKGGASSIELVIEARGKKEDSQLKSHLDTLSRKGTYYIKPERIRAYGMTYSFMEKYKNINGLQLSDLIAYPVARYAMDKDRANPAFEIIKPKIYSRGLKMFGFKTFP